MENKYTIISSETLCAMFEEEENSGRDYLTSGSQFQIDGLTYVPWIDTRTGKRYAARHTPTIHMGFNSNEPGTIERLIEVVEREGECKASWGVTGRTMHGILAEALKRELPQYDFEIGYNYQCIVRKR